MKKSSQCVAFILSIAFGFVGCNPDENDAGEVDGGGSKYCPTQYRYPDETVIEFEDKHLETSVREAVDKPFGTLVYQDVKNVTLLKSNGGIAVLRGLEYLTCLKTMYFSYNQIEDISSLSGLNFLTYVYLHDNKIADIGPLIENEEIGIGIQEEIVLTSNPLDCDDPITQSNIATLESRDVYLQTDCHEPF